MDKIIEDLYKKLNLNNLLEFENYLGTYEISVEDVKKWLLKFCGISYLAKI